MYDARKPQADELPSAARLFKSTVVAAVAAAVILVTIVLPAEYGIDPTRIGGVLGLTPMGEIKQQLADEAENDSHSRRAAELPSLFAQVLLRVFVGDARADESDNDWREEVRFVLSPGDGIEIKLRMAENAEAGYRWVAEGGRVNFDLHGDGGGDEVSYEKGRGVASDEGVLKAAFDGVHGWFWRNRDTQDVTVTLMVRGDFEEIVRP